MSGVVKLFVHRRASLFVASCLSAVVVASAVTSYQQRARYLVRAQGVLPRLRLGEGEVTGFVWNEVLMPVGHGDALIRLTQNRLGGGIGVPVSPRNRIEVGYMHLWNSLTASRVNEVNHTLTLSWLVK